MSQPDSLRDLGAGFRSYFEILPAVTDALRDDVYRIRHEVYCEQLMYESQREDRKESDEYDAQALHLLMRSATEPKQLVGCARLIVTRANHPDDPLPFERACEHTIDRTIVDPAKLPRDSIAEVSRLAVSGRYRRRKGEQQDSVPIPAITSEADTRFPYIPMGLYMGIVALSNRNEIETLFLIAEQRLVDHFDKLGFMIEQIGEPVEHRGQRVPAMIDVKRLVREMRSLIKPLYREVCAQVDRVLDEQAVLH